MCGLLILCVDLDKQAEVVSVADRIEKEDNRLFLIYEAEALRKFAWQF